MDGVGYGAEKLEAAEGPIAEEVAGDVDAATLKDLLLTIEREVIAIFSYYEFSCETKGGKSAYERACGGEGDDGWLGAVGLFAILWPDGSLHDAAGGMVVELFGDVFSYAFVVGSVAIEVRLDDAFFDFEFVEAFDAAALASSWFCLFLCGGCLLRCGCLVGGGLGLFWLKAFEFETELVEV